MIGVRAAFVGLHDLQPFIQITGIAAGGGGVDALARARAQHHEARARRTAPALLRRGYQHIDVARRHVDPHRAGRDAVEHEEPADIAYRCADGGEIVRRQDHAGRGFDVRREHHVRLFSPDGRDDLVDRRRRKCRAPAAIADLARFQHDGG